MRKNSFKALSRVLIVLLAMLVISSTVVNAATPTGTRLKNIQSRVLIGTEFPSGFTTMSDSSTFTSTAAAEFNLVTPENCMKWDATESSQNNFNFTEGDKLVSWSQSNNFKVHGHCMVWHSQTPSWVQGLSASAMQSAMNNHIDKVMGHFKGKILVWDVVNEAFNEDGTYRNSFWYNTLGKSFIENAFIRARAADPGAKLIYNDYNLEATGSKSNGAYNMLKDLKSRGIPVDGIGFQMHLDIQYPFNYTDFASNLQRFADLGLEIYITEMDVRVSSNPSSSELQTQANYYKGVIEKCMAQPAVKAIQVWGFTDKYSWVPGTFPGRGAALIFDSNYNPKASYYSMQSAIGSSPMTPTPTPTATPTPTPTPTNDSTATPTPSPTPTPTGTVPTSTPTPTPVSTGGIKVQFFNGNTAATTNTIYPNFKLVNTGISAVNLSDVKMRYYFTNDGTQANSFACDYSSIGTGNVTGSFTTIAKTNADRYLEVGFTSSAGSLAAGANAEVKARIWKSDWSNFTQTGDYSFNSTATNYVDSTTVTGYLAGALTWGVEP